QRSLVKRRSRIRTRYRNPPACGWAHSGERFEETTSAAEKRDTIGSGLHRKPIDLRHASHIHPHVHEIDQPGTLLALSDTRGTEPMKSPAFVDSPGGNSPRRRVAFPHLLGIAAIAVGCSHIGGDQVLM